MFYDGYCLVRGPSGWKNADYPVWLRPFVGKSELSIEEEDPTEVYWYKVYWDVRFPGTAPAAIKNSSWLRLAAPDGAGDAGTFYPYNSSSTTNPASAPGLTAITTYSGRPSEAYGAVRVVGIDNPALANPITNLSMGHYNFIVHATVEIYKSIFIADNDGQYSNGIKTGYADTTLANSTIVATINSTYPVDVLLTDNSDFVNRNLENSFDPRKISTTWPQYVKYNSTGYSP